MDFRESLLALMKHRKMKQIDICRKSGLQTSIMSDYCQGKKEPTIGNAWKIADALECTLDELVGRKPIQKQLNMDFYVKAEHLELGDVRLVQQVVNKMRS